MKKVDKSCIFLSSMDCLARRSIPTSQCTLSSYGNERPWSRPSVEDEKKEFEQLYEKESAGGKRREAGEFFFSWPYARVQSQSA